MSFFGSIWNGIKKVGSKVGSWFGIGGSKKPSTSNVSDYTNLIAGIAGLGSSGLNYVGSSKGLKEQYKYQSQLQNNAQQWATGMASTAHQLEVADMKHAGLNPILSATGGSGASAPSASGGSVGLPDFDLGEGLTTALAYRNQKNQDKIAKEQVDNLKADSYLKGNQADTESERFNTQISQTKLFNKQIDDLENQIKNRNATTAAQVERLRTQNLTDLINAEVNKKVGSANAYYNTHRALGFSSSWSNTSGGDEKAWTPAFSKSAGWNSGTSYSRSW